MNAKQKKIFDYLYFALLIVVSINLFLATTVFEYTNYRFLLNMIQLILQFAIIGKVILEWRTSWSSKDILLGILTAGIFLFNACKFNNEDAFAYAFLILGAKGVDKKKILNVFVAINIALFALTIGACLFGVIPNTITYRNADSSHARMALGFIYTTSLSAHFLILVVCYVFIREKRLSFFEIVMIGISAGGIYYLTEARIASFVLALLFVGAIVAKICYIKNIEFKIIRNLFVKWALILSSSILMLISVTMGILYKYDSPFWLKVNHILSERPLTNAITFQRYPVSMLGRRILLHCSIFDGMNKLPDYYYIINCSYIGILFGMGIIGAVSVLIVWTIISYREAADNNYLNLFILSLLTVFFFFEQRMFDFTFNPLLILLFSNCSRQICAEGKSVQSSVSFKNVILRGTLTGIVIAFLIETVGFNFESVRTFLYEGTRIDSAEVYSEGLYNNFQNDMYEYSRSDPSLVLNNLRTYDGVESLFCEFHFLTKEDHYHYHLVDNVEYSVECYSKVENDEYEYIGKKDINSSKRSSGYLPVSIDGAEQNIILKFNFPDDYYIYMSYLEFNGPKPFNISYIRLIILCLLASIFVSVIYIKRLERREGLVDVETKEELEEVINESVN